MYIDLQRNVDNPLPIIPNNRKNTNPSTEEVKSCITGDNSDSESNSNFDGEGKNITSSYILDPSQSQVVTKPERRTTDKLNDYIFTDNDAKNESDTENLANSNDLYSLQSSGEFSNNIDQSAKQDINTNLINDDYYSNENMYNNKYDNNLNWSKYV